MKKRGFKDFQKRYPKIVYHTKILLFSLLVTAFFLLILSPRFEFSILVNIYPLVFIQVEIFLCLGYKFFPQGMKVGNSTGQIITTILWRLLLFYLTVLIIAAVIFLLSLIIQAWFRHLPAGELLANFYHYELKGLISAAASGFLLGTILFLFFQWREALQRERKLEEEKLLFRYETLKNQVNPHFLFNSFNTLASLVETNPSGAGTFIHKLAAIYRYVLEKKELDLVPLTEEVAFAGNYFDLQKIRDGDKIKLITSISDSGKYRILPISLQILFENVFKHNSASVENPLTITVNLADDDYLEVSNPLRIKNIMDTTPGTGLHNLGERTRLITGKDIRIVEKAGDFMVRIPLILSEYENTDRGR